MNQTSLESRELGEDILEGDFDWSRVMDCLPDEDFVPLKGVISELVKKHKDWNSDDAMNAITNLVADEELLLVKDGSFVGLNNGLNRERLQAKRNS